jgi:phenylacetic acid degradation operon negative regulatory protein
LVVPACIDTEQREQLKRELSWIGFGTIASGVLAHPSANRESLGETLRELSLDDRVVVLRANTDEVVSDRPLKQLLRQSWRLDELEARFAEFVDLFAPLRGELESVHTPDAQQMFQLQTLLIHEYRRILLKTTDLPDELLPPTWSGRGAMALTAHIYGLVRRPTAAYLETNFEGPEGRLAGANPAYFQRFD